VGFLRAGELRVEEREDADFERDLAACSGLPLRLVEANSSSSLSLIDLYMLLDAPRRDAFARFPRLAASAAPAAICCFFDLAGIARMFRRPQAKRIYSSRRRFSPEKINGNARQHEQHSDS
jgi:hypothetical protein